MNSTIDIRHAIPTEQLEEWYKLADAEQERLKSLIAAMRRIGELARGQSVERAAAQVAPSLHGRGTSARRLAALYRAFRKQGWRALVRQYQRGKERLPEAFLEHWRMLCERNQRGSRAAYRVLIEQWRQWQAGDASCRIPGYALPPEPSAHGVPAGWTERNLYYHLPTKFALESARVGKSAASAHRPLVVMTRVGLSVGEYYLFDDLWHDHMVNTFGQRKALRPLEFHCVDLFSACKCAWAIRPMMEREDGTTIRLKEREALYLVAAVLGGSGYRPEGTALVVEHGTMAVTESVERMIYDMTGGAVRVERGGIQTDEGIAGQYAGRAKGNFRFKAALESLGNLIHNEMAALPGQVGRNRDRSPAEAHGIARTNDALLRAVYALATEMPDLAVQLRLPVVELHQYNLIAARIYDRINRRTEHELEGWVQGGLTAQDFRLSQELPWLPVERLMEMDEARREATLALAEVRTRLLSPQEVWQRGAPRLRKLHPGAVAQLLAEVGQERAVNARGMIEFEDMDIGPGVHRYLAVVRDGAGRETMLRVGEKFRCVTNPRRPDELMLLDAQGRYVGACPSLAVPSRNNTEGVKAAMGAAAHRQSLLMRAPAFRAQALAQARAEDTDWNNNILSAAVERMGHTPVEPMPMARGARKRTQRVRPEAVDLTEMGDGMEPVAPGEALSDEQIGNLFSQDPNDESY